MVSYNVFSSKKPKYQASGYGSQYYQPQQKTASIMPSGTVSSSASLRTPQVPATTTSTTTAPKQYLASGMDRRYSVNPTNYVAPKPTTTIPTATTTPTSTYAASAEKMGQDRTQFVQGQRDKQAEYIKQQYGLANQSLQNQVGQADAIFNQFKGDTERSIGDLLASGDRQKSQARDYYGEAQRLAAQNRNDVRGQTQRTFSNLNTIDSRGEGSFQQATENQDSEFNRFTQQNLKAQADKLASIDETVGAAERSARSTIMTKQQELASLKQQIQLAVSQNNLDQAQELTQAYNQTQNLIFQIEDSVAQLKQAHQLEAQRLQNAMQEAGASGGELKDKQALAVSAQNALDNLMFKLQGNPSIYKNLNPLDQNKREYEAMVNNAIDLIIRTRTGAAATKDEVAAMRGLFPQYMDNPELAVTKIKQLRDGLQSNLYGTDFQGAQTQSPTMDKYLQGNDPLGLGF